MRFLTESIKYRPLNDIFNQHVYARNQYFVDIEGAQVAREQKKKKRRQMTPTRRWHWIDCVGINFFSRWREKLVGATGAGGQAHQIFSQSSRNYTLI